jgi:type VI secretion system protein ImpL
MSQAATKTGVTVDAGTQNALSQARQAFGNDAGADPVRALEQRFEPLNALVRGGGPGKPVLLDSALLQVRNLRDYLMQFGSAANASGQALRSQAALYSGGGVDVVRQAQTEFERLPEPVRGWLLGLAKSGGSQVSSGAKEKLSAMAKAEVGAPCQEILRGRYPFVRGSNQDILPADFAKLFAANGVIDQFFQTKLKDFVDTTKPEWREMTSDKPLGLSAASLRQFQRAARIKDAFFGLNGNSPQVQFELKPLSLDNTVGVFRFNLEGQEAVYRHGPEQITKFQWPGPNPSAGARVVFETLDGRQVSRIKEGPWALFRLLDEINVERTGLPDRFNLTFQVEGYMARYELRAGSVINPFSSNELQSFRCPEGL